VVEFLTSNTCDLYHLTTQLLNSVDELLTRIEMVAFVQAYGRVIFQLIYTAHIEGRFDDAGGVTIGYMTHQEMSEDVGVARETVSVAIKRLERRGLIRYVNHSIYITKLADLEDELKKY
jgi:CRP-like cAMP-binding protein